ncbi:MAG: ABC transporter ATP-binding protein [Anaerolineales bacterium]|nr:ABC transporter ATP-binding protein [Anaerolineales bacterium]
MPEDFIKFEKLTKSFLEGDTRRIVLNAASGGFQEGEFVAILGRSGTGKSTLLNLLSGIDEPDSGHIWIDGQDLLAMSDHQRTLLRREQIGFVFQFFNLIPTLTVWENVTLPLDLIRSSNGVSDPYRRAEELLDQVGLLHRKETFPDRLSGGEQQRVAIARALVHDPKLVLADEPTGNLDEESGEGVLDLLDQLTRQAKKNLILVTHSRRAAQRADRIFVLSEGHLEPAAVP